MAVKEEKENTEEIKEAKNTKETKEVEEAKKLENTEGAEELKAVENTKETEKVEKVEKAKKAQNKPESQEIKKDTETKKEQKTEEVKKKSSKLPIIITSIILGVLLLIAIVVGAIFGFKYLQENKTVGAEWGDTYYAYLKEAISEDADREDYGLQKGMKNIELQFIETEQKNPVMVMTYSKQDEQYVNLYKTDESGDVDKVVYTEPADVEFLYNIENEAYSWYLHTETFQGDSYKSLNSVLEDPDNDEADYTIKRGEETKQETLSGDTITLSKFDETFVEPEVDTGDKVEFSTSLEPKELRENIEKGVEEFKKQEEIVTDEVKSETEEKVKKVEETKKSIEQAKEDIKKEEERKKAEELAKGLTVGSVTLKYGKYVSDVSQMDSSMYGTLILRPDGKFHIKANCEGSYPYKTLDCDGTYEIDRILNSFEYFDGLTFTTDTGVKFSLEAHSGNKLSDQWHGYSYVGAEE